MTKPENNDLDSCMSYFNSLVAEHEVKKGVDVNLDSNLVVKKTKKKIKKRKNMSDENDVSPNVNDNIIHANLRQEEMIINEPSTVNNNSKRMPDSNDKIKFCIASKLKEIRDEQGFVDDFFMIDFHEYNYFVESIPSKAGKGEFENSPTIPKSRIEKARTAILQSIPDADEEEIQFELTCKFYDKPEIFDSEISFLFNQCLRA